MTDKIVYAVENLGQAIRYSPTEAEAYSILNGVLGGVGSVRAVLIEDYEKKELAFVDKQDPMDRFLLTEMINRALNSSVNSSAVHDLEQEQDIRTECARWQESSTFLWRLLDDIDTLDDECRDDHVKFRERVRATQKQRALVADSDGYVLTWTHGKETS